MLRRRLDTWNFDLDQLLLGAMLFTLISFLFPTIFVYYVLFASVSLVDYILLCEKLSISVGKVRSLNAAGRHTGRFGSCQPLSTVCPYAKVERSIEASR